MKKVFKSYKKLIEYIVSNRLFLSYVLLSIIGTSFLRYNTLSNNSLLPFITDLGIILLLGSFGYFIKPKNQFKYFFGLLIFYTTAEIVNAVYYQFYTSFSSFGELASLSQAETVTGSILEKMKLVYLIYILLPVIFYMIHNKLSKSSYYNFISKVEKGKRICFVTFLTGVCLIAISFLNATKTDYSRLAKQWNRVYIVERFGILLYEGNDLFQSLRPKLSSLFGYDDAKELFTNYFSSEESKNYKSDNKYTGILEGKNIIFVHMEGMQDFLMDLKFNDQEVTPNLNALAKEGMFFSNFYPEVSTGTSSDTEFTLSSSLMPAASGTVFVSYYDRTYNSIQNILSNNNYYTFSMHGNYSSMWNRNKAHPSLGYQDMYFEESFTYTEDDVINLGINDKLFFKEAMPILENIENEHENYMGTIITLSNHSPFTFLDKYGEYDLGISYESIDEETGEITVKVNNYLDNTSVGNYIKSAHYADEALGEFLNYINTSEYFNDTIFVFYGDHDAKLSRKELSYLYNYNVETDEFYLEDEEGYTDYDTFDHELNKKTPLIIWTKNNKLKYTFSGEVDYYMGMIDVEPTILNMLGLYNEYALGHDIFNIRDNNVIPFPNGNFLTNMMYYNNSTGSFKIINENTVIDDDYVNNKKEYVENLLEVSNAIIVYDLLSNSEDVNEEKET